MGAVKGVAFDVDGTIIDSMTLHITSWAQAFERYGRRVSPEELQTQFGRRADFFVRHFIPHADDREIEGIVNLKRTLYRARVDEIALFPGTIELFEGLRHRKLRIGLATSASRPELDFYINGFGLSRLIDAEISGDEITNSKPDPEILEKIFDRLDVHPSSAVYVGDSPHDMAAAGAIGATAVGVLTGGYSESVLRSRGASFVFREIADISPDFLAGL